MDDWKRFSSVCFWLDGQGTRPSALGSIDSDILPYLMEPEAFQLQVSKLQSDLLSLPVPVFYSQLASLQAKLKRSAVIDFDVCGWSRRAGCVDVYEMHGSLLGQPAFAGKGESSQPWQPGFIFSGQSLDQELCVKAFEQLKRSDLIISAVGPEIRGQWSHWVDFLQAKGVPWIEVDPLYSVELETQILALLEKKR